MECPHCERAMKDTDLYCKHCVSKYQFRPDRKEDNEVLKVMSSAINVNYKKDDPEDMMQLQNYLNRLEEVASSLANKDVSYVSYREMMNIRQLILSVDKDYYNNTMS